MGPHFDSLLVYKSFSVLINRGFLVSSVVATSRPTAIKFVLMKGVRFNIDAHNAHVGQLSKNME